jgi:hypothetical protein
MVKLIFIKFKVYFSDREYGLLINGLKLSNINDFVYNEDKVNKKLKFQINKITYDNYKMSFFQKKLIDFEYLFDIILYYQKN